MGCPSSAADGTPTKKFKKELPKSPSISMFVTRKDGWMSNFLTWNSQWWTRLNRSQRARHSATYSKRPPTAALNPAGASNAPTESAASTNTVSRPASAIRRTSSDTFYVSSRRTLAIICGSPNVPSGRGMHTLVTSVRAERGVGLIDLISAPR